MTAREDAGSPEDSQPESSRNSRMEYESVANVRDSRPGTPSAAEVAEVPAPLGPHFRSVARRPRWIGVLLLVLAVASGFAFLGRWQLERAITPQDDTNTEAAVPLDTLAQPQQPGSEDVYWRMVSDDLEIVPGDAVVLSGRTNTGSETGYWVVVHAVETEGGASLAVASGWTASEDVATAAAATLNASTGAELGEVVGRYLPTESPDESDFEHGARSALATAELVNLWREPATPVYTGYLVLRDPLAGLDAIDSPPPIPPDEVNLLNLFYAVEWAIFAGAALFIWWRLVRDAELKELGIDPAQLRRSRRSRTAARP